MRGMEPPFISPAALFLLRGSIMIDLAAAARLACFRQYSRMRRIARRRSMIGCHPSASRILRVSPSSSDSSAGRIRFGSTSTAILVFAWSMIIWRMPAIRCALPDAMLICLSGCTTEAEVREGDGGLLDVTVVALRR